MISIDFSMTKKIFTQISISPIPTTLGLQIYEITSKQKKTPTHLKRLSYSMKSAPEFQERFLKFDFFIKLLWWDCSIFHNSHIIVLNITETPLVHPLTHWGLWGWDHLGKWKYLHNYSTSQSGERKWLMHCKIRIHIKFETSYQKN